MTIIESRERIGRKYGGNGRMAELKSLITEILEEESGDFGFIIEKLREKGEVYSDNLEREVRQLLKSWKVGLIKERGGNPTGRVIKYSLEKEKIFMCNKIISLEFELNFNAVEVMLKRLGVNLRNQEEVNRAIERYLSETLKNQIRWAKENGFSIKVTDKTTSFK